MAFGTAMTIGLIASGVGTGISTIGTIKAGNAQKRAGEAGQRASESQADLLEANAAIADLQADDAIARGVQEEQRYRQVVRGAIGTQRAGFAAGNINVNTGSAVDVQADAAMLGELDALTIKTNAAREAWGYNVQAFDHRKRAEIVRREGVMIAESGTAAQSASRWQAGGTLFSAGSSLLERSYGFGGRGR
jgi:hypothetical protein